MTQRMTFTESRVNKLVTPAEGRTNIYDSEVRELALRLTAAGGRSWYVVAWADGKQKWISLGKHPRIPVEQARELARETLVQLARHVDPNQEKRATRARAKEERQGGKAPLADALKIHLKTLADRGRDGGHVAELKRVTQAAIAAGAVDLANPQAVVKAQE